MTQTPRLAQKQILTITRPDDWHVHFRDGAMLEHTVPATACHTGRALVMPNLTPPLTTLDSVLAYRERILLASKAYPHFTPYMTLYLNETVEPEVFSDVQTQAFVLGAKLYPAGVTTNAEAGARSIQALYPALEAMQAADVVLQIHGEILGGDIFEREALFIEHELKPLMQNFPKLRVVLEHISTQAAVDFVRNGPSTLAATITPHHLLYNRNQLLAGGIRPHYYCLPILKHQNDQVALQAAAVSGNPKFFAGTDSAPHGVAQKECSEGCAGIYSAPFALSMYAEMFDSLGALDKLDAFLGRFGAEFYHILPSEEKIDLIKQSIHVPRQLDLGETQVVPVNAGGCFAWSVV
ncbi:MAG: dihydroorotase [Legionellaceae bacterium]|nr:dihydroorotase [Legionellaceae bacterium]